MVIGLLSLALIGSTWRLADDRLSADSGVELGKVAQEKLDQQLAQWSGVTQLLGATIDFQTFLRQPGDKRWAILRTYLNNLEDAFVFDDLIVVDAQGRQLFRYRQDPSDVPTMDPREVSAWVIDRVGARAYRVMKTPIWLGAEGGQGALLTYRVVEHQELRELASEGMKIQLLQPSGEVLASSSASSHNTPAYVCRAGHLSGQGMADYGCAEITTGMNGLRLVVAGHLPQVITPATLTLTGVLFLLAVGIAFYVVIGRWLNNVVRRMVALGGAAMQFDKTHLIDDEVRQYLAPSAERNDEIAALGTSLERLMISSVQREEEARSYLGTLEILQEAVIEIDETGALLHASPAWEVVMQEEQRRASLYEYLDPEDAELLREQVTALFAGDKSIVNLRLRTAPKNDKQYWLDGRFVAVGSLVKRVSGVLRDITQTYMQERQITHMALHDALTGLPNRTLLEDRLRMAFSVAEREDSKVGIGFIDLDHFKNVNDVLGHKAGDQLLLTVTRKLQDSLRTSDTLARWGGDEFVVLLCDMTCLDDIRMVAEKLYTACREAVVLEGHNFPVTFSMGFSIFPDDEKHMETLLSKADRALFYAKAQGRNNVQFFSEMAKSGLGRQDLYIQSRLADAINNHRIEAWFQPQVDITTGEVVGMEALARWYDPELGWVPPDTFIPMAETLGLIRELGDQIIVLSFEKYAQILRLGYNVSLSVNVSMRQLFFPQFEQTLQQQALRLGIEPRQVILEITESVAMAEVAFSRQRLKEIHHGGFRIAIDDFGVGHSSLSQLHEMPLDEIKIDMSFTRRVHTQQGARLVQAIVAIADSLGIHVVAEGVEDVNTSHRLKELGVHVLQGYLCGRPMSGDEFLHWLPPRNVTATMPYQPLLH